MVYKPLRVPGCICFSDKPPLCLTRSWVLQQKLNGGEWRDLAILAVDPVGSGGGVAVDGGVIMLPCLNHLKFVAWNAIRYNIYTSIYNNIYIYYSNMNCII